MVVKKGANKKRCFHGDNFRFKNKKIGRATIKIIRTDLRGRKSIQSHIILAPVLDLSLSEQKSFSLQIADVIVTFIQFVACEAIFVLIFNWMRFLISRSFGIKSYSRDRFTIVEWGWHLPLNSFPF